jgi:hypothetical protein
MEAKIRKQIYIDPDQNEYLQKASKRLGISEAELVRQALTAQARRVRLPQRRASAWERERHFLLTLLEQGPVPGGRVWKREDLYER